MAQPQRMGMLSLGFLCLLLLPTATATRRPSPPPRMHSPPPPMPPPRMPPPPPPPPPPPCPYGRFYSRANDSCASVVQTMKLFHNLTELQTLNPGINCVTTSLPVCTRLCLPSDSPLVSCAPPPALVPSPSPPGPPAPSNALLSTCEGNAMLVAAAGVIANSDSVATRWGWSRALPCSQWQYITCDSYGHVSSLNLSVIPGRNLSATARDLRSLLPGLPIPISIAQLGFLTSLDMSGLGLTGSIPALIGQLYNLRYLNLGFNRLTESIPGSLSSLFNLQTLILEANQLSGSIPLEVSSLSYLQYIDLSSNQLTQSIPSGLLTLTNLTLMDLSKNTLTGNIPTTLKMLTNLQSLNFSNNKLSDGIPSELFTLSPLQTLDLSVNAFSSSISSFSALTNLVTFDLSFNMLSGSIPNQNNSISTLRTLNFANNALVGSIPGVLGLLKGLQFLNLGSNLLTGSLPSELGWLCNIRRIDLSSNALTGTIPTFYTELAKLKILNLRVNQLSGPIPELLSSLLTLQSLDMSSNLLSGTISSTLSTLTNLQILNLGYNPLTGTVPWSLGSLSNLTSITLCHNNLNGTIPASLSSLSGLKALDLSGNSLIGPIPSIFNVLKNLQKLNLSNNFFADTIPIAFQFLPRLQQLDLSSNLFNGSIPSSISLLSALQVLDLSDNSLNGSLPENIFPSSLQVINIQVNDLSGTLPSSLGFLSFLTKLNAYNNMLTGSIPSALGTLKYLQILILSYNSITGSIPASIFQLPNLLFLDLTRNALGGTLPDILTTGATIDLTRNQLTGNIPAFISSGSPNGGFTGRSLAQTQPTNTLTLTGNYFTLFSANTVGVPSCNLLKQNCLAPASSCSNQRTSQVCDQFCHTTNPEGPCSGHGTCLLDPNNHLPFCTCDQGYTRNPFDPGFCNLDGTPVSAPPPPPPHAPPVKILTPVGVNLAPLGNNTFPSRNVWPRFFSLGYCGEDKACDREWNIPTSNTWMAPDFYNTEDSFSPVEWNPVRDQGSCSSCWAISVLDSVAVAAGFTGSGCVSDLAESRILNCSHDASGCQGGYPTEALDYAASSFIDISSANSSEPDDTCSASSSAVPPIVMYDEVQYSGFLGLLITLQVLPAVVIIDGSSDVFRESSCPQDYVLNDFSCNRGLYDHSVVVVGYQLNALHPYWIIRNSWSDNWCDGGYKRIAIKGGDGMCSMNALPAYVPIPTPPPGNPCYKNKAAFNPNVKSPLNPCGGGICTPRPDLGNYSYTCDCPPGFIAKDINVTISHGFDSIGKLQACAPVDKCGSFITNPCAVGTCVNDNMGGYSCICPFHTVEAIDTDGKSTCNFNDTSAATVYYGVKEGVTCTDVATTFNVTIQDLQLQNGIDCTKLIAGINIAITNPNYKCTVYHVVGEDEQTCDDITQKLTSLAGAAGTKPGNLTQLNLGINCTHLQPGQQICIYAGGQDLFPFPVQCTTSYVIETEEETCETVINIQMPGRPLDFYALNPGIDCYKMANPGGRGNTANIGAAGNQVCIAADPGSPRPDCPRNLVTNGCFPDVITTGVLDCTKLRGYNARNPKTTYVPYSLPAGRTCDSLKRDSTLHFIEGTSSSFESLNGITCPFKAGSHPSVICHPKA